MKIVARGGTDGANIVLFWPDNLPDDADAALRDDPIGLVEKVCEHGKMIWFPCDGDGFYSVAVYVRAPLPDALKAVCRDEQRSPRLVVRGDGYFGGMEYMFKHDPSFPAQHPGMCERVPVPAGDYAAAVFRTHVNASLEGAWLRERVGQRAKRLSDVHHALAAGAVAGVLASLASVFFLPWVAWFCVVTGAAALVAAAVSLSRTQAYKSVAAARAEFENAYPSYVVHLT